MDEELYVHAYDWTIKDKKDDGNLVILASCLDKDSNPYMLRINNFPAFCHIELPLFVRNKLYKWNKDRVSLFMDHLSSRLKDDAPYHYSFSYRKKIYYYRGGRTYPMIRACFRNLDALRHCTNLLASAIKTEDWDYIKCNVWESDITPIRKLLTSQDIKYSGWFAVTGSLVDPELRISTIEREYIVDWSTMRPLSAKETRGWSTKPRILAFDIECYSDNHRAMPNKFYSKHVAYMLSCVYQKYKDPNSKKRYGIVLGDCNHIPKEKLDQCEVIKVTTEVELVEEFGRIVRETDPEIIAGYNILSFDYPYLDERLKRILKSWPQMGRLVDEKATINTKTWKSGAYGHQSISMLEMTGRISVDMLPIIKRDYKLDKYDLNSVSKWFLGKGKLDIKAAEMFKIYEGVRNALKVVVDLNLQLRDDPSLSSNPKWAKELKKATKDLEDAKAELTRVLEYCIRDSELIPELMDKTHVWEGLLELSNVVGVTPVEIFTRGQQIRCISQLYDLASKVGYVLDRRDSPPFKFNGGHVEDPIPGLYDNIVCLDFASLYPSIIQALNICFSTLVPPELEDSIPDEECNIAEFDQEEDGDKNEDDSDDDEILDEKSEDKKGKVIRHYRFKYYKGTPDKKFEGLLPRLVRELVAQRAAVRAQIKDEKDPVQRLILDKRQLALKVSANSFFGFLGIRSGGKMSLIEGAMSITGYGRILIGKVAEFCKEKYGGKIVYGDTDSSMVDLNITDPKQCNYWGEKLSQEISGVKKGDRLPGAKSDTEVHEKDIPGLFPAPLKMEFEKAMRLLCIKKKKYVYYPIGKDGEFKKQDIKDDKGNVTGKSDKNHMEKKGIVLARRDNCAYLREVYTKILEVIMMRGSFLEAISILAESVQKLLDGKVNTKDLAIIRELGANYKSDSYFMKVFADNLKRQGKIVNPGDRLDFVIVKGSSPLLGDRMRLLEQFDEEADNDDTKEEIDYLYYIEKLLMKPINQLFEVGFKDILPKLKHVTFKRSSRHKAVGLDQPIKIIVGMILSGYDLSQFKEAVEHNIRALEQQEEEERRKPPTPPKRRLRILTVGKVE